MHRGWVLPSRQMLTSKTISCKQQASHSHTTTTTTPMHTLITQKLQCLFPTWQIWTKFKCVCFYDVLGTIGWNMTRNHYLAPEELHSHAHENSIWQQRTRQDAESRWGPAVRTGPSMPRPRAGASQTPLSYTPVCMPVLELFSPGVYLLAYHPHTAQLMPSSLLSRNGLSWSPLPFPALQLLPNQVLWIEKSNQAGLALVILLFKYYNWTKAFVLTG